MNANTIAKDYVVLTPEERFRLIVAAQGRGDNIEAERLANAGERVVISRLDHATYAQAFLDLEKFAYIERMGLAAGFALAFGLVEYEIACASVEDDEPEPGGDEEADEGVIAVPPSLQAVQAWGFLLRTKANGWELFCERLTVRPFHFWTKQPGFHRLQSALA